MLEVSYMYYIELSTTYYYVIMRTKLTTTLFALFLLLGVGSVATSCSDLNESEVQRMINNSLDGQWQIVNINVKQSDWKWNADEAQWEAFADLPELNNNIYEEGAAVAYIFLGEQGKDERQQLLPYVNTYSDNDGITFTETISCDFQLVGKPTVGFFIKDSQLAQDLDAPRDINFRVVLLY